MGAGDPGGNTVGDVHGGVTQIGGVHGDVHIGRSPSRRWRRVAEGAVGALVVVVAATIVWRGLNHERTVSNPAQDIARPTVAAARPAIRF